MRGRCLLLILATILGCSDEPGRLSKGTRALVHYVPNGRGAAEKSQVWIDRDGYEVILVDEPSGERLIMCKVTKGKEEGATIPFAPEDLVRIKD